MQMKQEPQKKIVLIDDSLLGRLSIRNILIKNGFEDIIEVDDGSKALGRIKETSPILTFLDLLMPEMDGYQVLEELQNQDIATQVIIVSADIQETSKQRCLSLGAAKVLNKPVQEEDVVRILEELEQK